jgi:hypothetical protein
MRCLPLLALGCLTVLPATPLRGAAAGFAYYVAVHGSDANPGDARRPLRTIARAALLAQPGDLVVVEPGSYAETVNVTRSGQPGAPVIFRGLPGARLTSPDPTRSLSAFDINDGVAYVTVQGFEMSGGFAETVILRPGAHDIEIAGVHIHDNHTGIWIAGASNVVVRDTLIERNYRTAIRIYGGAHHVQILDTRAEGNDDGNACQGDSDGFNADASTSDISFERSAAVGNSEDGFDLQGRNMTLLQASAQDNGCSGVKIAAGGYLENVLVERSRIGVNVNAPAGAMTVLENCTLFQNDLGLRATGSGHTLAIRNSIIAGPAKAVSYPASVRLLEGHNVFHRPLLKDRLIVRQEAGRETLYSGEDINSGAWQRASRQGDGTLARDAGLQADSCRPLAGSVAIDSGDDSDAAAIDLDGTPRPVGAAVDRGAFEWVPDVPTVQLRRPLVWADSTGAGHVWLRAEVQLPAAALFDPAADAVAITLRGTGGEVVRVVVPPSAWTRSRTRAHALWRVVQVEGSRRAHSLTMRVYGRRVSLRLAAHNADVWALQDNRVTLSVELGGLRARSDTTLRTLGGAFSMRWSGVG